MTTTTFTAGFRTWETDYRHGRRAHRHRCFACARILTEGERVFMARVGAKTTRAVHIECADRIATADWTFRRLMTAHSER